MATTKKKTATSSDFFLEPKSVKRMEDIVTKSKMRYGELQDTYKQKALCHQMANSITEPIKAFQRFEAACHVFGFDSPEANIFFLRAKELQYPEALTIAKNKKILREAPDSPEAEEAKKQEDARKKKFTDVSFANDLFM